MLKFTPLFSTLFMMGMVTFRRVLPAIASVLALCCYPNALPAQEPVAVLPRAERAFDSAVELFRSGDYAPAAGLFDSLAQLAPLHRRTSASILMAAKSRLHLKEYGAAAAGLSAFFGKVPSSAYADDAHYTLGAAYFMMLQARNAATELERALDTSLDPGLIRSAEQLLDFILAERCTGDELRSLMQETRTQDGRDRVAIELARRYSRAGETARARLLLDEIASRRPPGRFRDRAAELAAALDGPAGIKVGVLLPLMKGMPPGMAQNAAEQVLDGVTSAAEEFRASSPGGEGVSLVIRDTGLDSTAAKRIVAELATDRDVLAVIGPLYSGMAFAAARAAGDNRLPMVSPTANAPGISAVSPYVFQANPDLATGGRALARYAVEGLNMRKLAIVSPQDAGAALQADAFAAEASRLGAEIVARETYVSGSGDLQEQFMDIRKTAGGGEPAVVFPGKFTRRELNAMVSAGADRELVDSLRRSGGSAGVTRLFGERGFRIAESLKIPLVTPRSQPGRFDIPLTSVQGIFAPVTNGDDIGVIASQMLYYNIRAGLLGNGEWNDLARLETNRRYVNGAVFCSDSYEPEGVPGTDALRRLAAGGTGRPVTKYTLFGYDTARMLLECIGRGAKTRDALLASLSAVREFRGVHATIGFDGRRINRFMNILQYRNGEITRLAEIAVD